MKKLILYIFLSLFFLFGFLGFLRFVVGGSEDTWICSGGEWVKYGVPSAPMPEGGCGD